MEQWRIHRFWMALRSLLFLALCIMYVYADARPCVYRQFNQDSVVCVCNATYCDMVGIEGGGLLYTYFNAFVTSKDGKRLDRELGQFDDQVKPSKYIYMVENQTFQEILGFGGAFTDAATITMNSVSAQTRQNIINSYFDQNGIEYNIGRIPMASCDFSTRIYSYDDSPDDLDLTKFSLVEEDLKYKIPAIKDSIKVSKRNISLFGSPWSSPFWMKTNGNMTGKGQIKGQPGGPYFKAWANYFVKFLKAYKEQGLDIWGLTAQNEPSDGEFTAFSFQCLGWTPQLQRDFIAKDLGPALEAAGFSDVKLMILDDQRVFLPYWADIVLQEPKAAKYISGIAVHWYEDLFVPVVSLDITYEKYGSDFFMLNTEACEQDLVDKKNSVLLGNWYRGERYFRDILQDLGHGVTGWVDWNIALNMAGGPNWDSNFADSPIIVNPEKDEFYKQPMFYAMGHFSKFIRPGSKRLAFSTSAPSDLEVEALFFLREDGSIAASFINSNETSGIDISIKDFMVPGYLNFNLPAKSFVTFIWYRI